MLQVGARAAAAAAAAAGAALGLEAVVQMPMDE